VRAKSGDKGAIAFRLSGATRTVLTAETPRARRKWDGYLTFEITSLTRESWTDVSSEV
jgi:hypothetical protein